VDPHLLPHLLDATPRARAAQWFGSWLPVAALVLALLALAGPAWERGGQPAWQVRTPLVLALDLSGSIAAADLPPSRLAQARAKLASLLRARSGGQVGLLAYAEDAYVVAPLTDDAANVALFQDALSPGIMPGEVDRPGRADRAIERGQVLLRQAGFAHGDILLLAGEADAAAIAAARNARAEGHRVSVLGLGTAAGAPWRASDGTIRHARLDAASLRRLAHAGGGRYAPLARDDADLATLDVLDARDAELGNADEDGTQAWRDQGYWLLLPLLLLVAFAFRRGGALALLAACLLVPWQPAGAAGSDWWQRPDQQVHARMQAGAEAYRQGRDDAALQAWQGLPGADAAYNRGNALARQGRYEDAIASYDDALRQAPGMADARANREAVRRRMRERPPETGAGDTQPPRDPKPPSQAPAGKPEQQAGADAGQRKQMDEALQQAPAKRDEQGQAPVPGETQREREQRLANQAWLQRVPDDPGGLLRARFQLEYQRRREQGR
jgi:Ca-activated chloride channel family protein